MNGDNSASSGKGGLLRRAAKSAPGARSEDAFDDVVARKDPEGLRKGLTTRHIQMIAFGGAIGTGLFYGSAEGIKLAGPSILLAYALGGVVIFFVVRAMGEMSVHRPSSGSFSRYANDYWSPRAGFVAGWNYWFNYIAVAMAELTVVGQYIQYWFPSVPAWASAAVVLLVITAVNLVGVKAFGEFEFWFSAIKVAAVVGMIVLGLYVIAAGVNSNPHLPDPSFGHLFSDGFLAKGLTGLLASLVFVMFSFGGIELIGITAGEAENPQRSIPRAVNQVVYRILIFYIGALTIVMAVVPWRQINGKLSPFVQIFDSVGISVAAHVLNFVVLTAALSVYNSGLYSNGRMLYSLARQGNAPKAFMRLSRRGIPYAGVLFSSMVTAVSVAVIYFLPDTAFSILMAMALGASIISWVMILLTHRAFRKRIGSGLADLAFKLPGGLASNAVALVSLVGVFILMAFNPDYRTSVAVMPIWLFILFAAYEVKKRSSKSGRSERMQEARR
jgi:aromatic amino acid transporter